MAADLYGRHAELTVNGVVQRMRWIAPGRFLMGSPKNEPGRDDNEGPQHEVLIEEGFWLGDTPCTQMLWKAVMGNNPSLYRGPQRPVEKVAVEAVEQFLSRLSGLAAGLTFRLPFEAEWEFACRAGTTSSSYAALNTETALTEIAWFARHGGTGTKPVSQLRPNANGLYDMLGNVWEWCADELRRYAANADPIPAPRDPATNTNYRVVRGGSWNDYARLVRSAHRFIDHPTGAYGNLGFRLVCAVG